MGEKVINLNYRYLNICKYGPWEEMKTNDIQIMYKLVSVHVWVVVTSDRGTWYELWEPEDDLITVSMVTTCHLCPTTDTRPPNQTKPSNHFTGHLWPGPPARLSSLSDCWIFLLVVVYCYHLSNTFYFRIHNHKYQSQCLAHSCLFLPSFSSDFAPLKLTRLICSSARVR